MLIAVTVEARPSDEAPQFPTARQANITLAILVIAYICSLLDRQILSLMVDPIRHDLGLDDVEIGLLQGPAFALFYCLVGVPIGRLADRLNRKYIAAIGIFLWSLMTMAAGLARSFPALFLARMGVGVGEAALAPAANSLLSDVFPPARLPRAIAILTVGMSLGAGVAFVLGGSVLGFVAQARSFDLPLLGALRPWQLAFLIVGCPGLVVSALVLVLREPARHGVVKSSGGATTGFSVAEVFAFMAARKMAYGTIFAAASFMAILAYDYLSWYPTFLMRTYGVAPGKAGYFFGVLYMVFGAIGAFGSGRFAEYLRRRGFADAAPRTAMIAAIALVPMAAAPLMPNVTLAFIFGAPTILLLNAYYGVTLAALQLITPNQMRAVMTAMFLLVTTLIGLGLGSPLIGVVTQMVFHDPHALRYSLALTTVVVAPLAGLAYSLALRPYRAALAAAESWLI